MPDVKEVINGLEMSYKYSNVDENNTLVPQWIVLHAIALLKENERIIKHQSDHLDALLKAQEPVVMAGAELTDAELIEEIRKAPLVLKPNVDAVPVVRCRDCKWFDCKNYVCNNDILAGRIADCGCYPNFNVELDWFCADGERRDSE